MKKIIKNIWDCLFEVYIYFLFLWMSALAIICSIAMPKQGISALMAAIALTLIPKLYGKFKKAEEE